MPAVKKNKKQYSPQNRILGSFYGTNNGPTIIVFAGIHGNEKAGVYASEKVISKIAESNIKFKGNVHFILGNINALNKGVRFEKFDLNRIWRNEHFEDPIRSDVGLKAEKKEKKEILSIVKAILLNDPGPFFFLDLHTTSASSVPFITISDSLNNRKFSSNFPVPVVFGIEEFLDGPLLTFINEYGHIALGFEGGAHEDPSSVVNCEAFIWKALVHSKCIEKGNIPGYAAYQKVFENLCCKYQFFAIKYRYEIKPDENFSMRPGFENFEPVKKDSLLAFSNGMPIPSPRSGRIFMPLYQKQGEDGFFVLKKISKFWLWLSIIARRLKFNHFLRLIPGVNQDPENNYILIVNPKVARYLTLPIFHLFGYRQQIFKDDKLHFIKRDRKVTSFP